jgi:hypothetical protein
VCIDADGDNYGTGGPGVGCVTNGASGGTTSCTLDTACLGSDCNDAANTCTTNCTSDTDRDGFIDCRDSCTDVDGDHYGTAGAGLGCVTNGASGGTTSRAQDNTCLGSDCNDAASTCNTGCTGDSDGDGTVNCLDACTDVDGDTYGVDGPGLGCVTDGAKTVGTPTACALVYCIADDCDDGADTCTTNCGDGDQDGFEDCRDLCLDIDGDNYGVAGGGAGCVADGGAGGATSCEQDAQCLGADCNDAASTCSTACTGDADGDGVVNCLDGCTDADGDSYGQNGAGAACVKDGASGGTTPCSGDPVCLGVDCNDAASTCRTTCSGDADGDGVIDCQDACLDPDGDDWGDAGLGVGCVTDGAKPAVPYTSCELDTACKGADVCPGANDNLDADGDTVPDGCDVCAGKDDRIDVDDDNIPDGCDCDGNSNAPACSFGTDCTSCLNPSADVCQHLACSRELVSSVEQHLCSNTSNDGATWGPDLPCRAAKCISGDIMDHSLSVGTDCAGASLAIKISYEFNTRSASGTLFRVWMRNLADGDWDNGEQYNCILTGVTGVGDFVFSFTRGGIAAGDNGTPCVGFAGTAWLCWMTIDSDSAVAGPQPVALDQGQHNLTCAITTNRNDEIAGYDGILFTTNTALVPDPLVTSIPCGDVDLRFTQGDCNNNWTNLDPTEVTKGVCEIVGDVDSTMCATGGNTCCGGSCVNGSPSQATCP